MNTNMQPSRAPILEIYENDDLREWIGMFLHAGRSRNLAAGTVEFYAKKLNAFIMHFRNDSHMANGTNGPNNTHVTDEAAQADFTKPLEAFNASDNYCGASRHSEFWKRSDGSSICSTCQPNPNNHSIV